MGGSFLTLQSGTLTDRQRRALLKLACAIAWADGTLVESEQSELAKSLEELGGIPHSEFSSTVMSVKQLDDATKEELREIPVEEAHQVVKLAYRVADADGHIRDSELAVIRDACAIVFAGKPWQEILDWLRSHQTMSKLVDLAPGALFAEQFRVVERLSEGGMGAIYKAEQLTTGAMRALKLNRAAHRAAMLEW